MHCDSDIIKFKVEIHKIQTNFIVLKEVAGEIVQFFVAFANSQMKDCFKLRLNGRNWSFCPLNDEEIVFHVLFNQSLTFNFSSFRCALEQPEIDKIGKEILKHINL